jgi:hypothetical protein
MFNRQHGEDFRMELNMQVNAYIFEVISREDALKMLFDSWANN